jgi:hypothetical protein
MTPNNSFAQAVSLTESLYTYAAIHVFAEENGGVWLNRYTSVTYGRPADLRSIPPTAGNKIEEQGGKRFLCLRQRLPLNEITQFVEGAVNGRGIIADHAIIYDLEPAITGFRPSSSSSELHEASLWNSSGWSREYIGKVKEVAGFALTSSTAWKLQDLLGFLQKVIWMPIPVREHPEKLGDLDEFWPTPISFGIRRAGNYGTINIEHNILSVDQHRVSISGALIQNDLISDYVSFTGLGPHLLSIDPDAIDLTLSVDGIPFDTKANRFISRISMNFGAVSGIQAPYVVPEDGARPEMKFALSNPQMSQQIIGRPPDTSVRQGAWIIGKIFRMRLRSRDAERFYDPDGMTDSVLRAFADLQQLGTDEQQPRVLVADPYALDERALYAIGVISTRLSGVASIDIVTEFKSGTSESLAEASWSLIEIWKSWTSKLRGRKQRITKRQDSEMKAFATADRVAGQLKVRIRFYRAERLHDRFLVIGERLWHVGPSFNKIGEEISAIVEMTDEKIKSQVLESLARFTSSTVVHEAHK